MYGHLELLHVPAFIAGLVYGNSVLIMRGLVQLVLVLEGRASYVHVAYELAI